MQYINALVRAYLAMKRCEESGNYKWEAKWEKEVEALKDMLPKGSGFDNGTEILSVQADKVKFSTYFHHMDSTGLYTAWTKHVVTVTSNFEIGAVVAISGRNYNGIKDYMSDVFYSIVTGEVPDAFKGVPYV